MREPTERAPGRAAAASFIGAVIEWYDFLLYGVVAAMVFAPAFFPSENPTSGLLVALATFGVGFLFRPLGGVIFGYFGDRLGRKRTLIWTITLMGLATAAIGALPTYRDIGWLAPVLLVALRAVQGLAVGGEWGSATLMAVESAPAGLRAFYSSGVQVGYSFALLVTNGLVALLRGTLGEDAFQAWGWRLPFLFSLVLVAVGLWIRAGVPESPVFRRELDGLETAPGRSPLVEALTRHPAAFGQIIALRLAELFTMYIVTTFTLGYARQRFGFGEDLLLGIGLLVGGLGIVTIPLFAWLSDRFGRRPVYLGGAVVGVFASVPYFLAMQAGSAVLLVVCAVLLVNVAHDAVVSVQQPLFTELFGVRHRNSGAGFGYQLASAIGGFTPFLATGLVALDGGSWRWVAAYLTLGCLASAVVAYLMRFNAQAPEPAGPRSPAASANPE